MATACRNVRKSSQSILMLKWDSGSLWKQRFPLFYCFFGAEWRINETFSEKLEKSVDKYCEWGIMIKPLR